MRSGGEAFHRFNGAAVVIAGGVINTGFVGIIKKAHMHRNCCAIMYPRQHSQIGSISRSFDLQVLTDGGFHIFEVILALPITFQIHIALRLDLKQARVKFIALLLDVSALLKRQALVPFALEITPPPGKWLQPLRRCGLTAVDVEVVKLVAVLVDSIIGITANIVDDEFSVVDYGQTARGGVAEELVAEASQDAGDDFHIFVLGNIRHSTCRAIGVCDDILRKILIFEVLFILDITPDTNPRVSHHIAQFDLNEVMPVKIKYM